MTICYLARRYMTSSFIIIHLFHPAHPWRPMDTIMYTTRHHATATTATMLCYGPRNTSSMAHPASPCMAPCLSGVSMSVLLHVCSTHTCTRVAEVISGGSMLRVGALVNQGNHANARCNGENSASSPAPVLDKICASGYHKE